MPHTRPAQASLTLRPIGSLSRPRRPLSRGSSPAGYPAEPLVSYRINRQFSGWNLPPQMFRAFGAHGQFRTNTAWPSRSWPILFKVADALMRLAVSFRPVSIFGYARPSAARTPRVILSVVLAAPCRKANLVADRVLPSKCRSCRCPTLGRCLSCQAVYRVVEAESGPETIDGDVPQFAPRHRKSPSSAPLSLASSDWRMCGATRAATDSRALRLPRDRQ